MLAILDYKVFYIALGALLFPIGYVISRAWRKHIIPIFDLFADEALHLISVYLRIKLASLWSVKRYAQILLAKEDNSILRVPSAVDIRLNIDNIFVPLTLEQTGLKRYYRYTDIFDSGSRIQIVGDPGSGKSSIVKKLFRDNCKNILRGRKETIPVIIELRKLQVPKKPPSNSGEWLKSKVISEINSVNAYNIGLHIESLIERRGLLILLDGLDEVSSESYEFISKSISNLSSLLANKSGSIYVTKQISLGSENDT